MLFTSMPSNRDPAGVGIVNPLLKHYLVDVDFPEVSGDEHLEMLQIRGQLSQNQS